ncbi:hypothetical protein [Solibacillus sp. FSL K6-1523]|uniref:hypothetical protein n=1 Tax=Solibacillus sp. FSL K6-1523 TaxID=2921471 RepID=UPI0030F64351
MRVNFGKYDIPSTLQTLIDLANELGDDEQFYLCHNFYLSLENFRYFNTPSDVVVFGNIGMDGIHYGFLTDYGSVTELDVAPIVCVSPMDFDRPTRVVANNLREFLQVNLTDSGLFYNHFDCEEDYVAAKNQWSAENVYQPSENEKLMRVHATKYLSDHISMPVIENPYRYVHHIELERQKNVTILTQDRIGVVTPILQGEEPKQFLIHKEIDPDLQLLREYLQSAPKASCLALFRDIQLNFIIKDNPKLFKVVTAAMINMELFDETNRLLESI